MSGQHAAVHAAEAASTEQENAKLDSVLEYCDRIRPVTEHHVRQLQRRRQQQRRQQRLGIIGALGDLGENVVKLLTVDENTVSVNVWVTQTGALENEKNQRNAQSSPQLRQQQRQQHCLLQDGENGLLGPLVRNLVREECLSALESVSVSTKTAMAKVVRQKCAIANHVRQLHLQPRQKIQTAKVSGQSGASGKHVQRCAVMVEQFVQENACQTVTETVTVQAQRTKRNPACSLNPASQLQQVRPRQQRLQQQ